MHQGQPLSRAVMPHEGTASKSHFPTGLPPEGQPWGVDPCGNSAVCQIDVTVTVKSDGSCTFTVPDVKDAKRGVTKKFLWKIKSADPGMYRVGFKKLEVNPPGDSDLLDDGTQPETSEKDSWRKVFQARTLSFLTYDIYAWYRRSGGAEMECSNNPHGPAVTNRG